MKIAVRWLSAAAGGAGIALLYGLVVHPWMAQWGSIEAERQRVFPGVEIVPAPVREETRAITVRAPASVIWAWLGQIGRGRGGFYSYDWLENLFGLDIHNVYELRPELKWPLVGDTIRLASDHYLGGRGARFSALTVVSADPRSGLVLEGWGTFAIDSLAPGISRLIVRERIPAATTWWSALIRSLTFDPVHFVMERRMLRGIRDRAEGRPQWWFPDGIALVGFASAAAGVVIVLVRRSLWGWLVLPLALAFVPLVTSGDARAALAGFVAVGLTIVALFELRAPAWMTLPGLVTAAWLVLFAAPDAFIVLGWLLGALTIPITLVALWLGAEHPATDRPTTREKRPATHAAGL